MISVIIPILDEQDQLGGLLADLTGHHCFHEIIMEDLAFSKNIRRFGRYGRAPGVVRVSGRRFLRRPVFYTFAANLFPLLYRLGVPPAWLAAFYNPDRQDDRAQQHERGDPTARSV